MEPGTEQPQAEASTNKLAERKTLIETALRGISQAALGELKSENAPPAVADLLDHGLTLVYCGLMALTEIAHAQMIMANLARVDMSGEINALAEQKANAMAEEHAKVFGARSFIGQKP